MQIYNQNYDWELIRLASKLDTFVIGGASRLFSYFIKKYQPKSIISYCDRSLFSGKIYNLLGFKYLYSSTPNYYYTNDYVTLLPRQIFQKHKLKDILENYDENLSEWDNMFNNGYNRYYDCGNMIFEWKTS